DNPADFNGTITTGEDQLQALRTLAQLILHLNIFFYLSHSELLSKTNFNIIIEKMKKALFIMAFALLSGTYTVSAQESAPAKKPGCCASKKSCSSSEKAKC